MGGMVTTFTSPTNSPKYFLVKGFQLYMATIQLCLVIEKLNILTSMTRSSYSTVYALSSLVETPLLVEKRPYVTR